MRKHDVNLIGFILEMSGIKQDAVEYETLVKIIESSKNYEDALENYKPFRSSLKKYKKFYESQFFRLLKIYYDPYLKLRVQSALENFEIPDIPGDLHVHTTWSDGINELEEMVEYAEDLGYEYIAITDHTLVGKGRVQMDEKKFLKQLAEIERLQERHSIRILKSAEVDVNEDGKLDYSKEILELMDFVMVSIHFDFGYGPKKIVELFEVVSSNEIVDVIGHPLNKLGIEGFKEYGEKIIDLVEKNGKVLELNLFPDRIKENDLLLNMIKDRDIMVAFSTDSHRKEHLEFMRFANFWLDEFDKERIFNFILLKNKLS